MSWEQDFERKEDFALTYAHGDNHPNGDYGCSQSTPIIHPRCLGNKNAYDQPHWDHHDGDKHKYGSDQNEG